MYSLLLAFILNLCLILCVKCDDSVFINGTTVSSSSENAIQNYTLNEHGAVHMKLMVQENNIKEYNCNGFCSVDSKKTRADLSCSLGYDENQKLVMKVSVLSNITKEYSGKWTCRYNVTKELMNDAGRQNTSHVLNNVFRLDVEPAEVLGETTTAQSVRNNSGLSTDKWKIIGGGAAGALILLIIVGQTICIVHFKKKAAANQHGALWSKRSKTDEGVRYSKMPGQIKNVVAADGRESGIYEVLENVRIPPAVPEPPSLQSLPRKKGHKSTPPEKSPAVIATPTRSTTNSMFSLKKKKKALVESDTERQRSSVERIKERPPLPLPGEEVYEALEDENPQPESPKRDVQQNGAKRIVYPEKEIPLPEDTRDKPLPVSKPPVLMPSMMGPNAAVPAQLKEALEMRLRQNAASQRAIEPTPPPKPLPKTQHTPILQHSVKNSPVLKQKGWPQQEQPMLKKEPHLPREKMWAQEPPIPKDPYMPRGKVWAQEPPIPKDPYMPREKVWPQEPPMPKRHHLSREELLPQEQQIPKGPYVPTEKILPQEQSMPQDPYLPREKVRPTKQPIPNKEPYVSREKAWFQEPSTPRGAPYMANEKVWAQESLTPRGEPYTPREKVWPQEHQMPKIPYVAKEKVWPQDQSKPREHHLPIEKVWPQEQQIPSTPKSESHMRKEKWPEGRYDDENELGGSRANLACYINPGLPPPDAPPATVRAPWGDARLPKTKPQPPTKPKQLRPLPPLPGDQEPYQMSPGHEAMSADQSDDEEWTYEPIQKYNIYSL